MRVMNYRCAAVSALILALTLGAWAQTPPAEPKPGDQTPPAAQAPPPAPVWSVGPIDFSGLIDVYADKNFNNPGSGFNGLRNFDLKANTFSLNMGKLMLGHDPDPVGFHLDFGF